jgi:hypothetical protein
MVNTRAHIVIVTPNPGFRLSWKEGTQMISDRVELRIHLGASALPDCSPFSSTHRSSTSGASFLIIIADMHPSSEKYHSPCAIRPLRYDLRAHIFPISEVDNQRSWHRLPKTNSRADDAHRAQLNTTSDRHTCICKTLAKA